MEAIRTCKERVDVQRPSTGSHVALNNQTNGASTSRVPNSTKGVNWLGLRQIFLGLKPSRLPQDFGKTKPPPTPTSF